MKRTLIIHPGIQRTATTSVQEFFYENFAALRRQGILYPFRTRRHVRFMNRILNGDLDVDAAAADLTARADAQSDPVHTIVLSDEAISLRRDLSVLARFRQHFDVKIVMFLRRQDLWLESWYFQNIKWQWNPRLSHCTLDEFLARRKDFHWLDYDRYVTHLEKLFGSENVEVAVFEADEMPGGPVHAFCSRIGLNDLTGLVEPKHTNASLSPAMSEFIRHLPIDQGQGDLTRRTLVEACQAADDALPAHLSGGGKLILPHDVRRKLLNNFSKGNTRLAKRRFGRNELFRDPPPDPREPVADLRLPDNSDTLMTHFIAPVMGALIRQGAIRPPDGKGQDDG